MQNNFDCRYLLDNHNICILEVALPVFNQVSLQKNYRWLLLNKADQSVKLLSLQSRDDSNEIQERYFNLGYLKFNPKEGIFIETGNKGQHPLKNKDYESIPLEYLKTVENFLSAGVHEPHQ